MVVEQTFGRRGEHGSGRWRLTRTTRRWLTARSVRSLPGPVGEQFHPMTHWIG